MLVLTRKVGEIIRIGDDIAIQVLRVNGNAARIGISAPQSISIDREEIYQKKFPKSGLNDLSENFNQSFQQTKIKLKPKSNIKMDPKIKIKKKKILDEVYTAIKNVSGEEKVA